MSLLPQQRTLLLNFSERFQRVITEFICANSEMVSHCDRPRISGFQSVYLAGLRQTARIEQRIDEACLAITRDSRISAKVTLLILVDGSEPLKQYQRTLQTAAALAVNRLAGKETVRCRLVYTRFNGRHRPHPPRSYLPEEPLPGVELPLDYYLCSYWYSDNFKQTNPAATEYLVYNLLNLLVFSPFEPEPQFPGRVDCGYRYWSINPLLLEFPLPLLRRHKLLSEVYTLAATDYGEDDAGVVSSVDSKMQHFLEDKIGGVGNRAEQTAPPQPEVEPGKLIPRDGSRIRFDKRVAAFKKKVRERFKDEQKQQLFERKEIKDLHDRYSEKLGRLRGGLKNFWKNEVWDNSREQAHRISYWKHLIEALKKQEQQADRKLFSLQQELSGPARLRQLAGNNSENEQLLMQKLDELFARYRKKLPSLQQMLKRTFVWFLPVWLLLSPMLIPFYNQLAAVLPGGLLYALAGVSGINTSAPFAGIERLLNGDLLYSVLLAVVLGGGVFGLLHYRIRRLQRKLAKELQQLLDDGLPGDNRDGAVTYVKLIWQMRLWRSWRQLMQEYRYAIQQLRSDLNETCRQLAEDRFFRIKTEEADAPGDFFDRRERLDGGLHSSSPLLQSLEDNWSLTDDYTTLSNGYAALKRSLSGFISAPLEIRPDSLRREVERLLENWQELDFYRLQKSGSRRELLGRFVELVAKHSECNRLPWPVKPKLNKRIVICNEPESEPFFWDKQMLEEMRSFEMDTDVQTGEDGNRFFYLIYGQLNAKEVEDQE